MRADSIGLFWEDIKPEKLRKQDAGPDISKFAKIPENGLGFPASGEIKSSHKETFIPNRPIAVMDIECFTNYFLVMFQRLQDDKVIAIESTSTSGLDSQTILDILDKYEIVTFNGNHYDLLMLRLALSGASTETLKEASDDIIYGNVISYKFEQKWDLEPLDINHIDLKELSPGQVSLKTYAGRLHCPELQDLPIEHNAILTEDEMIMIRRYCKKDLAATKALFLELFKQVELRRSMSDRYRLDLRSKSDAQIAEAVLTSQVQKKSGRRIPKVPIVSKEFCYDKPKFIKSNNSYIRNAIGIVTSDPFVVGKDGRITMPKRLSEMMIKIGDSVYQMGMGGLHSTENCTHYISGEDSLIVDWDVASYYPSIILNCGLYPKQLGETFLDVYREIVEERLAAKAFGDKIKADALKITINGSFGKLGSPYSVLYAPELMVQVTVTGQLSLLMLIDELEQSGMSVVSANTDGIVVVCDKKDEVKMVEIINNWQMVTGFEMENTKYKAIFSRDVNNYIAIKPDGSVKTKGTFGGVTLSKNPQTEICSLALIELLKSGTPFIQTIKQCKDITKFVTVRQVKGGAVKNSNYLGKVVRWYYGVGEKGMINYKTNGNMVPKSQGAVPIMDFTGTFPDNIDYLWYEKECKTMLYGLGLKL